VRQSWFCNNIAFLCACAFAKRFAFLIFLLNEAEIRRKLCCHILFVHAIFHVVFHFERTHICSNVIVQAVLVIRRGYVSQNTGERTLLYVRDRDSKNMLSYNEFSYKKIYNHCKLEDRFQKKGQPHIMRAACTLKNQKHRKCGSTFMMYIFNMLKLFQMPRISGIASSQITRAACTFETQRNVENACVNGLFNRALKRHL